MVVTGIEDSSADLDQSRRRLEDTLERFRKALQHWQLWEVEYEGIKEDLLVLPTDASANEMLQTGNAFEGELVNEKEVKELIGYGNKPSRTKQQVCDLISRRIEYVRRNVETVQKQFTDTKSKLANASIVSQKEEHVEEELPMTEILEVLDEEDNVISGTTSNPGDEAPQMIEALKQAGVRDEDFLDGASSVPMTSADTTDLRQSQEKTQQRIDKGLKKKKSVAFAEGTKPESPASSKSPKKTTQSLSDLAKGSFTSSDRVIELDEYDNPVNSIGPSVPINESPEDVALRRQMLQYNMGEMNHIVAQLDLEEGSSDGDEADDNDDEFEFTSLSSGSGAEEEEDDHGMATGSRISSRYRKEMLELEKALNIQMMENIGQPNNDDHTTTSELSDPQSLKGNHRVHFVEHLDIAPAHNSTSSTPIQRTEPEQSTVDNALTSTMTDAVVERKISQATTATAAPSLPKKATLSRFKQSRLQQQSQSRQVDQEQPVLSDVIEHSSTTSQPAAPDDFDPVKHDQEIRAAYEYHQQRYGSMAAKDDLELGEEAEVPSHELDQPQRKISRFKASRLQNN